MTFDIYWLCCWSQFSVQYRPFDTLVFFFGFSLYIDWTQLPEDKVQWLNLVNVVTNLKSCIRARIFLNSFIATFLRKNYSLGEPQIVYSSLGNRWSWIPLISMLHHHHHPPVPHPFSLSLSLPCGPFVSAELNGRWDPSPSFRARSRRPLAPSMVHKSTWPAATQLKSSASRFVHRLRLSW
jgi:hypothetical protein